METTNETILDTKKEYQSPILKDLGKIGEVTNTTNSSSGQDSGTGGNYGS